MNFSQLEVFVAIAETGSFSAAANRVGLTRSAASHALANLEAELGVALLERERGNAIPTAAGNCMLHHAREILSHVETMQQEAAAARGLQSGKLRVGIVSSISADILSGILGKFRQAYPGIEIVSFEGTGQEVDDWIRTSTVDVGFVLHPTLGMDTVTIGSDEVKVMVPLSHSLRRKRSIRMSQLKQEPFIQPKMACDFLEPLTIDTRHGELHKRYEATEVQTVIAMVREGLGISMLPGMLLPLQIEGVHLLSLEPPLHFSFGVAVRSMRHASPAAKMFIQSAQTWAAANGFEPAMEPAVELAEEAN